MNTGAQKVTHRLQIGSDFLLDELPNAPTPQQMADVFTVKDYRALKDAKAIRIEYDGFTYVVKPGAEGMRGHHIVTIRIQEEFRDRFGVGIPDVDDSPVKVFTTAEHYGTGSGSLHNRMNAWNDGKLQYQNLVNFATKEELINELLKFYKSDPSPDWVRMVKATRGWAAQHGISFSE